MGQRWGQLDIQFLIKFNAVIIIDRLLQIDI